MSSQILRSLTASLMTMVVSTVLAQQAATLNIDTTKTVHSVSPTLYGLMTEEINHSYDGGLYAQLLSNHTFRTNSFGVDQWGLVRNGNAKAAAVLDKTTGPSTALPTSLKLSVEQASLGNEAGMSNPSISACDLPRRTVCKDQSRFVPSATSAVDRQRHGHRSCHSKRRNIVGPVATLRIQLGDFGIGAFLEQSH
jgi:hypothetical protein